MIEAGAGHIDNKKFKGQIQKHISSVLKENNKAILNASKPRSSNKKKLQQPVEIKISKPKIIIPDYFGDSVNGVPTLFIEYIQHKINQYRTEGSYLSGIALRTTTVYQRFMERLIEYKEATGIELDIKTATIGDAKIFLSWFISKKHKDGTPYKKNYVEGLKKEFHNFIRKAINEDSIPVNDRGIKIGNKFWKSSWEKQHDPYLTYDHLNKLKALKFGKKVKRNWK